MLLRGRRRGRSRAQWRRLIRAATFIAVLTSPIPFLFFYVQQDWALGWALLATFGLIIAYRGLLDIVMRRLIPWPSLFGADEERLREEDVVNRRRAWFWSKRWRFIYLVALFITIAWLVLELIPGGEHTWWGTAKAIPENIIELVQNPAIWIYIVIFPLLFLVNFLILMGPLMLMGITQIQSFEPGDADWGVKLEDVRGQAEAKEEVRKIVSLWQSGEAFEQAGGKRERGILFLGPPGHRQDDALEGDRDRLQLPVHLDPRLRLRPDVHRHGRRDRPLPRLEGEAARTQVGRPVHRLHRRDRRRGHAAPEPRACARHDAASASPLRGARVLWALRGAQSERRHDPRNAGVARSALRGAFASAERRRFLARLGGIVNQFPVPGGMGGGGGQLALNQLLVVMDGIGNPPYMKRLRRNWFNTFLDATYVVPRRLGKLSLRLPRARPRNEQIYFIGACNVPIQSLDPALTRPGRLGRHVWFRTPTKKDRLDIFDLYIDKVAHSDDLDTPRRRDEIARVTNGSHFARDDRAGLLDGSHDCAP